MSENGWKFEAQAQFATKTYLDVRCGRKLSEATMKSAIFTHLEYKKPPLTERFFVYLGRLDQDSQTVLKER